MKRFILRLFRRTEIRQNLLFDIDRVALLMIRNYPASHSLQGFGKGGNKLLTNLKALIIKKKIKDRANVSRSIDCIRLSSEEIADEIVSMAKKESEI